jgi:preprotein translocase subunit SecG
MSILFAIVLSILSIFLVLLVLVQRGRGGGLTGALGGVGGSSAFGAKAGDIFTRITIVVAAIWIAVCVASVYWANHRGDRLSGADAAAVPLSLPGDLATSADTAGEGSAASGEETSAAPATDRASDEPADGAN